MTDVLSLYHETIAILERQSDQLFQTFSSEIHCKKGCSNCCINGFKIRYIEGLRLLEGFQQLPTETAAQIVSNTHEPNRPFCPLLIDGACALYEHRPALCRAFGVILQVDDTLATCDLNFKDAQRHQEKTGHPPEGLQKLDITPFYETLDSLSQTVWEHTPLPALSTESIAPRSSIQKLFQSFIQTFGSTSDAQ